jgi:hypothetical protein
LLSQALQQFDQAARPSERADNQGRRWSKGRHRYKFLAINYVTRSPYKAMINAHQSRALLESHGQQAFQ